MTEAERLAEEIESWNNPCARAAAELRRLSAINAELVQALSDAMPCLRIHGLGGVYGRAQAALEKAKQ